MENANYGAIVGNYLSPTLVLAGPGAGKTYLLADRIKHLVDKKTPKGEITVLTFGRDANQHMIDELTKSDGDFRFENADLPPKIKTLHGFGFEIARQRLRSFGLRKTNLQVCISVPGTEIRCQARIYRKYRK